MSIASLQIAWPHSQRTFPTSRPSAEPQYVEHVASPAGTLQRHERFSQRIVASLSIARTFPVGLRTKRALLADEALVADDERESAAANAKLMSLAGYPGFQHLTPELQGLLLRVEGGEDAARPALLERAADVLNVFIGLDLLQYVFMPTAESDGSEPVLIDLISPAENEGAIAWFSVDEAGYDEFRDAVTLFGDVADLLNPPIVLDIDDDGDEDDDGEEDGEDDGEDDEGGPPGEGASADAPR